MSPRQPDVMQAPDGERGTDPEQSDIGNSFASDRCHADARLRQQNAGDEKAGTGDPPRVYRPRKASRPVRPPKPSKVRLSGIPGSIPGCAP
jgi:hypothetical protein